MNQWFRYDFGADSISDGISHDLAVIRQMCDRVIVMKDGEALEQGTNDDIFENPQHSYTKSLLEAMPRIGLH